MTCAKRLIGERNVNSAYEPGDRDVIQVNTVPETLPPVASRYGSGPAAGGRHEAQLID